MLQSYHLFCFPFEMRFPFALLVTYEVTLLLRSLERIIYSLFCFFYLFYLIFVFLKKRISDERFVEESEVLIMFDFPLDPDFIGTLFTSTHTIHQKSISGWSTISTRQKVMAGYWLKYVTGHFAILFGLAAFVMLLVSSGLELTYLSVVFVVSLICFPVLLLFTYLPIFYYQFLPQLETIKENYERKQFEQVEKCRQAQLSNFSLCLFFYALAKTNHLPTIKSDDKTANLLMKLFGVDGGSIKKNMELILIPLKRKNLTERKITELRNRFDETLAFMEELQFAAGIEELTKLELQFFKRQSL